MAKWCPVTQGNVLYPTCLECEDRVCETGEIDKSSLIPLSNGFFLDLHETDDGEWDYTLYNDKYKLVDGGRFGEGRDLTKGQALAKVLIAFGLTTKEN